MSIHQSKYHAIGPSQPVAPTTSAKIKTSPLRQNVATDASMRRSWTMAHLSETFWSDVARSDARANSCHMLEREIHRHVIRHMSAVGCDARYGEYRRRGGGYRTRAAGECC